MYLKRIVIKNAGPINDFDYDFKFQNNKPVPLIVMGNNGKGKTILTSYISDLFFELARNANYTNITESDGAYFRYISKSNVRFDNNYGYSIILAEENNKKIDYVVKSGEVDIEIESSKFENYENKQAIINSLKNNKQNFKKLDYTDDAFENNILASFVSYRSEKPSWMNDEAITYNPDYIGDTKISNKLNREIIVNQVEKTNEKWLIDVIIDSMLKINSVAINGQKVSYNTKSDEINWLLIERSTNLMKNINQVLSKILKKRSELIINRRETGKRLSIKTCDGIIPTLENLSLGESILFNLFISIIRHGELSTGNLGFDFFDLTGVVVIDEIDMHLDIDMQYKILPELIGLFPGIQFVITTHSPLFTLGMKNAFEDRCDFIKMPDGLRINVEDFDEFKNAYDCIQNTETYNAEMNKKVNDYLKENETNDNPLVITEGSTDWKHIKNAFDYLCNEDEKFKKEYLNLKVEFLEYESSGSGKNIIQMGGSSLATLCESLCKVPRNRKIICIADNDDKEVTKKVMNIDNGYKAWGNNIYSFTLPIPSMRSETPDISIEHFYSDKEIKTEIKCKDDVNRRLFIANEFNSRGYNEVFFCNKREKCGKNKYGILDSCCQINKLSDLDDSPTNYVLSKSDFVKGILENKVKISKKSYDNFRIIFDKITEILNLND